MPYPRSSRFPPKLFCSCFLVLHFTLRCLILFELMFVKVVRSVSRFIFLHVDVQLQNYWLKRLSFLCCIAFAPSSKISWLQNRNRFPDLENELMVTRGESCGEGIVREFGIDMYTMLYIKWITNKDLLYSTGKSAQCYVAAWMGGEFGGRMYTCICTAESLCCAPETITTLLISYIPI